MDDSGEAEANARKRAVDSFASDYIDLDWGGVRRHARQIVDVLDKQDGPRRLAICGATGSQKTTLAEEISHLWGEPAFDLDELIPDGYTNKRDEYEVRLWKGWDRLAESLPRGGWIVEHVEAANPHFLRHFQPRFLLRLDPGKEFLEMVAHARTIASGEARRRQRESRIRESQAISRSQFNDAGGVTIRTAGMWTLKKMGPA